MISRQFVTVVSAVCLSAFAAAEPGYYEAMLTLPSTGKMTNDVKCRVWVQHSYTRVDIGQRLVLLTREAPRQMVVIDLATREAVTVGADPRDPDAVAALNDWEGALFPLLPGHAGPGGDWNSFDSKLNSLSSVPSFDVALKKPRRQDGMYYADYNVRSSAAAGRVSWGFTSGSDPQMVTWSFQPLAGKMRSMHLGEGVVGTGKQRIEYGYGNDSGPAAALPEPNALTQSTLLLSGGSVKPVSGFLNSTDQATNWLLIRTAYLIGD